jgi:hypothetical protein
MRYHIGLGIGHVYTQRQASSDVDQETAGHTTRGDDMEEEFVEIPDDDNPIIQEVESSSEHSSDFGGNEREEEEEVEEEEEEEIMDKEFFIDEDLYGY